MTKSRLDKIIYRKNIIDLVRSAKAFLMLVFVALFLSSYLLNQYSLIFIIVGLNAFFIKEAIYLYKNDHHYKSLVTFTTVISIIFGITAYIMRVRGYLSVGTVFIIFAMIIHVVSSIHYGNYLMDKWRKGLIISRDKPEILIE